MSPLRGLRPSGRISGTLRVPTSKSIAQRALVAAALTGEETRLTGIPDAADVQHLARALGELGAELRSQGAADVLVRGRPPGPGLGWRTSDSERALDLGESGTAARFVTAAAALCGQAGRPILVGGSGSLARRASPALFAALVEAGARLEELGRPGGWPVRVTPIGPPSRVVLRRPSSSQEVSALAIALAAWPGPFEIEVEGEVPSRPYVGLTERVLESFGVALAGEEHGGGTTYRVRGPLRAPSAPLAIEPDASAAAVGLAAAALSGGRARVPGLDLRSAQGDVRIVEHLAAFGVEAGEEQGALWAAGRPTRGAELDLSGEPDLAPVLAAVAAGAALWGGGASRLTGLATLPGKESSRIEVLAGGLARLGLAVEAGPDALAIAPGRGGRVIDEPLLLDPAGDHRMAFAFALLGLVREGVRVADSHVVAKSWPGFWTDLAAAGAEVIERA